jgi:FtsZ-interacting cell division protein ZipA
MLFYSLLGLLLLVGLWSAWRIRNLNNRVDAKELAKSWEVKMPQEIRDYKGEEINSTISSSQPIISDTSEVKIRDSGPGAVKRVSQLEHDKEQYKLFAEFNETKDDLLKVNSVNEEIHKKAHPEDVSLLKVYVCESGGSFFDPERLVSSLNIAGLTFGEMDIFHYYEEGSSIPAFSAASMLEPGTFDLERLQLVRTSGIVLFVGSGLNGNWSDSFSLMLNTAKRIAASLDAVLYSAPEVPWTEEHEQKLIEELGESSG